MYLMRFMNFFKKSLWEEYSLPKFKAGKKIKNPTILAFSAYFHDSSACIIKNGKIIAAADEERFTRKKHDSDFPKKAIDFCLKEAGVKKVDGVIFFENPAEKWKRIEKYIKLNKPNQVIFDRIAYLWQNVKSKEKVQEKFKQVTGLNNKVLFLDHHLSHASSSYFVSGFSEAAVVTIDGVGENSTTTFGYGKNKKIKILKCINFPNSIGLMYTAVTTFLGFKANDDEYKVMGLSAYGNSDKNTNPYFKLMKKLVEVRSDGSFKLNMKYFSHERFDGEAYTSEMIKLFKIKPRKEDEKMRKEYEDIASALQMLTEEMVFSILRYVYKKTKCENLCLAGGVALNSVLNGKIIKNTPFKKIFIQPSAGDSGTVIGAAKYLQYLLDPKAPLEHIANSYFGPKFSDNSIKKYLDSNQIKYQKFESREQLLKITASLLKEKKVIGWFQGRMEWGPRALGNRSILASSLSFEMQNILNEKVKHREMFRPFAPAICEDDTFDYFECDQPTPEPASYMLMVYPIKKEKQELIPAVTHVDGSGRLQVVNRKQNPLYYDLIKEFGRQTGVPILVNTSFNVKGEPIVCAPNDAYKCMLGTEIDCLVMNNFLILRKDNI